MLRKHLLASVSSSVLALMMRTWERAAKPAPGSVVWPDGTPVLACDTKILAPYKLVPRGEFYELQVA